MTIIYSVLAVNVVIFFLWVGCFVGREFGSYEKLVLDILDKIKRSYDND